MRPPDDWGWADGAFEVAVKSGVPHTFRVSEDATITDEVERKKAALAAQGDWIRAIQSETTSNALFQRETMRQVSL